MSPAVVERMMSITRTEFLRLLPLASTGWAAQAEQDDSLRFTQAAQTITLAFRAEPDAAIASLRLPRLHVRIEFETDTAVQQSFMQRFDRVYQRGGG